MAPSHPATPTPSNLQRDADIWLEDGSIVLVASHAVAFRIYKSLLAHHATIFNDMFSLGHSDVDGEETVDNVPVVHLADSPDALRIFLLILMSSGFSTPRWSHPKLPEQLPFSTFDGLLRIAHKYEAMHILPLLSKFLDAIAYNARDGLLGKDRVCRPAPEVKSLPFAVLVSDDDILEVLDLARFIGADDAIAAAMLWQCCVQGPLYLRDGITRDGIVRRLSEEDYVRCVAALPQLLLARRDLVLQTARSTDSLVARRPCSAKGLTCAEAFCDKYTRNPPPMNLEGGEGSAVVPYDGELSWNWSRTCMCNSCYGWLLQDLRKAFQRYWEFDLPKIFQL